MQIEDIKKNIDEALFTTHREEWKDEQWRTTKDSENKNIIITVSFMLNGTAREVSSKFLMTNGDWKWCVGMADRKITSYVLDEARK